MITENIRFRKSVKQNLYTIEAQVNNKWLTVGLLFDNEKDRDLKLSELRKGLRFGKLRVEGRNLFSLKGNSVTCMTLEEGIACEK